MSQEVNYNIGPQDDNVPPPIVDQQLGQGLGLQGLHLGGQVQGDRHNQEEVPPVGGAGHGEQVVQDGRNNHPADQGAGQGQPGGGQEAVFQVPPQIVIDLPPQQNWNTQPQGEFAEQLRAFQAKLREDTITREQDKQQTAHGKRSVGFIVKGIYAMEDVIKQANSIKSTTSVLSSQAVPAENLPYLNKMQHLIDGQLVMLEKLVTSFRNEYTMFMVASRSPLKWGAVNYIEQPSFLNDELATMNEAELRKVEKEKMQLDSKPKFIDLKQTQESIYDETALCKGVIAKTLNSSGEFAHAARGGGQGNRGRSRRGGGGGPGPYNTGYGGYGRDARARESRRRERSEDRKERKWDDRKETGFKKKRGSGACFHCGSLNHQIKNCTKK